MATCPNCGNQTGEGAVFCDQCGTRIPAPEPEAAPAPASGSVICPACGAGNVPGEAFCDFCGSPLEAPVPAAEAVPDLEPVSSEAELEVVTLPAEEATAEAEAIVTEEEAPTAEAEAVVAEEEAPPAVSEAPAQPAVAEEKPACPACGADVLPGEAFCANCGASLAAAPIPPEPVVEPAVEAESAPTACPACGAAVEPGDTFCSDCGAALRPVAAPAPVEVPVVETPPPVAPAGPRLVAVDSGAEIMLQGDEILIGREDPVSGVFPDVDLTPHGGEEGGVSRRHARIFVEGGAYFVEDLDSTNFTFVNKQKLAPKTRQALNDGDEIRCGRVALVLKTS